MTRTSISFALLAAFCGVGHAQNQPPLPADQAQQMAAMQQHFLMQFDMNKDGKLSQQEEMMAMEAMRKMGLPPGAGPAGMPANGPFFKMFDKDGDGQLNPMESAMATAAFQKMRGGNGHRGGGVQFGPNMGTPPPQPAIPAQNKGGDAKTGKINPLVKRFDKDGDGKLNDDEKAAAQEELKGKKKDKEKDKEKDAKSKKAPAKKPDAKP